MYGEITQIKVNGEPQLIENHSVNISASGGESGDDGRMLVKFYPRSDSDPEPGSCDKTDAELLNAAKEYKDMVGILPSNTETSTGYGCKLFNLYSMSVTSNLTVYQIVFSNIINAGGVYAIYDITVTNKSGTQVITTKTTPIVATA